MHYGQYGWHMGGWGWFGMALFWVALLVLVAIVAASAIASVRRAPVGPRSTRLPAQPPEPSAEELLKRRYVRGEIDTATYERMRDEIRR